MQKIPLHKNLNDNRKAAMIPWVLIITLLYTTMWQCDALPISTLTANFDRQRDALLAEDTGRGIGANLTLTPDELIVDRYIIETKKIMMDDSRLNKTKFWPRASFYESKAKIDSDPLFKIIKQMPKGGALHIHDIAITSLEWLVKNATYRDHVWMCMDTDNFLTLTVDVNIPNTTGCDWKLVDAERKKSVSANTFDEWMIRNISFLAKDPLDFDTVNIAWFRFNKYFTQILALTYYAPIMRDYYRKALEEFLADGVQYIELRSGLAGYYEFDAQGNKVIHDAEYGVQLYRNITQEFKYNNPDFLGAKIIFSGLRSKDSADILQDVIQAIDLHRRHPDMFLGYDLVGQEDPSHSLQDYLQVLLYPASLEPPYQLPYFFHAGETNWQGTQVDQNLFDALLLNATRLGHAYALSKHPRLMEIVKERGVAIEVNPISNQVLALVKDVRDHAMVPLIADDFPIVISSDDPGAWEAAPLSHDFYIALMTMTGRDTGLRFLKKLAINSLQYSAMSPNEKDDALKRWEQKWQQFIQKAVKEINVGAASDASVSDEVGAGSCKPVLCYMYCSNGWAQDASGCEICMCA